MSNLSQNQNQTFQTPMLAQVTSDPQPNTIPAQLDPASTAPVAVAGCSVKLVAAAGPIVIVDICATASDGPVFGVIPYNLRKNTYAPGDSLEVVGENGYLMLKAAGALARGVLVSSLNPSVSTNDPVISLENTVGNYVIGRTVTQLAAAGLIKVKINPGYISSSTTPNFSTP